jgi:hypothetical protein
MPARRPTRRALLAAGGTALAAGGILTSLAASATEDPADTDRSAAGSTATSPTTAGWPSYHGTPGNTGYVPETTGPESPVGLAWTHDHGGWMAVDGDTVYVQADDGVHALKAADGSVRWTAEEIGAAGGISVAVGTVYVGGEQLTALDAATGDVRWVVEEATTAPVVAHETVYTMAGSTLAAYEAQTGASRWKFTPDRDEDLYSETSVAFAAGTVFAVSPSFIFARNAADGSERWTYDAGPPDDGTGPRFEGAQPHHLAATEEIVVVPEYSEGGIDRIGIYDVETGERQWRTSGGVEGAIRVTITDDRLYVQGLYATGGVNRETGENEWFAQHDYVDDGAGGLPVATDEAVYVATHDGLRAVDEDDDATLWTLDPEAVDWGDREGPIAGYRLAVAGDTLYASGPPSGRGHGLAAYRTGSDDDAAREDDDASDDTDDVDSAPEGC